MLLRAQRKARQSPRPLFLVEADALALPFRDGSFDVVSVAFGFRNVGSHAAGLRELRRVLKPGGTVAILEFSHVRSPVFGPLFRFYSQRILPRLGTWISGVPGAYQYLPDSVSQFPDQESLAAALPAAGFVNVRYRNFTGGVAALHLAEKR
jgi:demethylmenaquinone methyltransferase/2-methoxy-6-polyprenyl-1,4-benzoquinol methylase